MLLGLLLRAIGDGFVQCVVRTKQETSGGRHFVIISLEVISFLSAISTKNI